MVKGVNKSVIEINNTEDSYIERAILFINPEKASRPQEKLKAQANAFLKAADKDAGYSGIPCRKGRLSQFIRYVAAFLCGAAVSLLLYWLLL